MINNKHMFAWTELDGKNMKYYIIDLRLASIARISSAESDVLWGSA